MIQEIHTKEQIPQHSKVLFDIAGEPLIDEHEWEDQVAVLRISVKQVSLLTTRAFRSTDINRYVMLKKRLNTEGYTSIQEVTATAEIVKIILDTAREAEVTGIEGKSDAEHEFVRVVTEAYNQRASDIHIVREERSTTIRFRINGEVIDQYNWPVQKTDEVMSVAYNVLAINKDIMWDRSRMQDTEIQVYILEDIPVKLRYSSSPLKDPDSYHVALRVLRQDEDSEKKRLESLGYTQEQIKAIKQMVSMPTGLTLVVGETGSGKSTTITALMELLYEMYDGRGSFQSVEDPPEYNLKGTQQSPVVKQRDKGDPQDVNYFAKAIRSSMRRDPDVLLIGEIRDEQTAKAAISATQSGHKVLATLHASSAAAAISRLADLGMPREVMGSPGFFAGIFFQALVPVLCEDAKEDAGINGENAYGPELVERLSVNHVTSGERLFTRGTSPSCPTGIAGRTVVAEVMQFDDDMLDMIKNAEDAKLRQTWLTKGVESGYEYGAGMTYRRHAWMKVRDGIACAKDVEKKVGPADLVRDERG